ncbi:EAL domain-containing protein [Aquabacterium sp. G14]|uniref:putative bifunctional diguanylate cyclase/phosphodiesterase n=1 Tax=Aquabacterium sp. G14 TaxID=3130164 RepID=UPI00309E33F2
MLGSRHGRWLMFVSATLSLGLLALVWSFTWQRLESERMLTRANAHAQQQNLTAIISENLGQVIDRGKLMAIAAESWFGGHAAEVPSRLNAMIAADRIFLRAALYDDALRRVYASSPGEDPPELRAALLHLLQPPPGQSVAHIALAPRPQRNEQAWQVPLLLPVPGPDDRNAGVLLVVLDLGYFLRLYQHIDMGRTGLIQVVRLNGEIIAEARQEGLVLQSQLAHTSHLLPVSQPPDRQRSDERERGPAFLSSHQQVHQMPFQVIVSREMDEILAPHMATRERFLSVLLLVSALFLAATTWVTLGIRRQASYAAALAEADRSNRALITQLEEEKRRAFVMAAHDPLTGLPNRRMFNELLSSHLQQARRNRKHYALMYMDLDRFKEVNDTLGHHVGDLLLQAVSARLRALLRESDLIARLGGDEFAILLTALPRADDAAVVAGKLVSELCKPFTDLDGHDIQVSPSIGVALFPRDGNDTDALCRNADAAMYQSKRAGRARYTFYDASLNPTDARLFNLAQRLPHAIADGELVLHFQPKVSLNDYQISGFEALVRWQHPELGLIYPNDFIPLAERTGAILELGDWVAEACCRQLASWRKEGQRLVPIAFNVSAVQLHDDMLPERISQLLHRYDLPGELIQVEITETCLVESMDVANTVLHHLERLGIHISLDDYGSGFSSLGYIRTLPIHCLKIDRGFIHDIRNSPDDAVIVSSIITLAHNLNMCVVAEGVELVDQLVHLKTAGCDQVQGYFFSRPVPATQASALLSRPSMAPT